MTLYDITRTVRVTTAVWPGDVPFSFVQGLHIADGASVNLTTMTLSPHTGTHADAYFHYEMDGEHPAQMPLAQYIGRAQVITVTREEGVLTLDELGMIVPNVDHVLIHSHVSDLPDDVFPERFPYASAELIAELAGMGVRLLGLDSPSMDALDSTTLPAHHALRAHRMVNLELLQLRGVPDGIYEHIALPLKLDGVCGSPVRAVLRSTD